MRGRTAIVTGGARGIGEAVARRLAREGMNIALWDVMGDAAGETARALEAEFGVRAAGRAVDVTSEAAVEEGLEATLRDLGGAHALVNNAGVTRDGLLIRMREEDWDLVLGINLKGVFLGTKVVGRHLLKAREGGSVVNVSSVVGAMGNAGQANYAASKAGVVGLTKTSAREFAARGVRVNAVAPGYIRTPMTDRLTEEQRGRLRALIPLGSLGEAGDVAEAVAFLVSDASRYVTGQVLHVNGGMYM